MSKYEEKYQRYADRMCDALLALMETRPFHSITVSEICKAAQVQRSTFYAHYRNTSALLQECEERLVKQFSEYWTQHVSSWDHRLSRENLRATFAFLQQHQSAAKAFLQEPVSGWKTAFLNWIVEKHVYPETKAAYGRSFAENIALFYFEGIRAVAMHWIEGNCRESVEEMCDLVLACVTRAL